MKVVIVGGVAGGATAAARLRRLDEHAQIVVLERTGYVSYANCGLPYYIGGAITDRRKLTLQTPESFMRRFRIDVRVRHEVTRIDRAQKFVEVERLDDGSTYREPYDKLILAPGARAVRPDVPGIGSERLFTLRTVEDTFAIADFIDRVRPRTATVVGGGFIGLEMAENLTELGIKVAVVQRPAHVMPTLDSDMAAVLQNHLRSHGVELVLNAQVDGFEQVEGGIATKVSPKASPSGADASCRASRELVSDMVVLAVGVLPESELAAAAGLELGQRGSIKTDATMRTSDPDIYAVGDAVEVVHAVSGRPALVALAGPANKQGRIAADAICGVARPFAGSQGSSVMKAFDMTVASTGLTSRAAEAAGLDCDAVVLSPASHATYYPGAESMTLKVLFERGTWRILGAQAVGGEGVDKRIDVLAVAVRAGMTAFDLTDLDLAYAPPYSSAKDPVNMAGYLIENIAMGKVSQVQWDSVENPAEGDAVLDVRTQGEYDRGHIEGALHIALDDLRDRLGGLPRDRRLLVYCQSGLRSYLACRILAQEGFDCANVAGGYGLYAAARLNRNADARGVGPCGLKA